jgi:hypothetical protein
VPKLNVTAFVMAGITAANPSIVGEPFRNADGQQFLPLCATNHGVSSRSRDAPHFTSVLSLATWFHAAYVAEMFSTNQDSVNSVYLLNGIPTTPI